MAAAAAAAAATSSSSSHQQQQQQSVSSKISEGTFRPPGSLLLRLVLRHFRHEINSWCFAVSDAFRKRCLAGGFLP